MKLKRFFWILIYVFALLFPSILYLAHSGSSKFLYDLAGFLGITSYVLLSFQFLLLSRPKIIDKAFGLDRIYRFHMIIAVVAILFAYFHKMLKGLYFSDSNQTEFGDQALTIFIVISVFSILMMINKLFFKVKPIDYVRTLLNKILRIKYQYKVLIHNLYLIALIVLLIHILLAYSISSNLLLESTLIIYFVIPFALYFNRKIINVYWNKNKRFTVTEVVNESDNIVTLKFKPKHGKLFKYLPGQFLYVRLKNPEIPGDEHPFTISSSPAQDNYVSVTVKQLGDFSGKLSNTKVGDTAIIDGAFGSFSYVKGPKQNKLCFIAGGIGITPFLSMLRYINDVHDKKDVVLLWGARDLSEVICKGELEDLAAKTNHFQFVPVLSNDNSFNGEKGFIGTELIKKYITEIQAYDFYICGPPVMLDIQLKNLKSLGVPKSRIHFERFSM
jgi:Predicted ferric reductase